MNNNDYWAIYPGADISAGPVQDMERAGYPVSSRSGKALLSITGPMIKPTWAADYGYASTSASTAAVNAILADDEIEEALIIFDTPGGSVDGLADLGDAIAALAEKKLVVAQVDGMLASAGYYAASQATEIRAGRMDMIGSIGVRMVLVDTSKLYGDMGVKVIPIDTGEHKSAGLQGTEITESQQAEFQRIVDGYMADFKAMVQSGRGLSDKQFQAVSTGAIWHAQAAMQMGLIDKIQSTQDTIKEFFAPSGDKRAHAKARMQMQAQKTRFLGAK